MKIPGELRELCDSSVTARYALRLMTGLMPDIRGMHRTNLEYAEALEAQDRTILS